jgi:hypothetical protein
VNESKIDSANKAANIFSMIPSGIWYPFLLWAGRWPGVGVCLLHRHGWVGLVLKTGIIPIYSNSFFCVPINHGGTIVAARIHKQAHFLHGPGLYVKIAFVIFAAVIIPR